MHSKKLSRTKPLLYSDEVDQRVSENLRAKLISQLIDAEEGSPREFTSYFHGPRNNVNDPSYTVTSHATNPIQRRRPVIPAYQSVVQALRWCPYVDVSSIEDSQSDANEPKFHCKCRNCQRPSCPAKRASSAGLKPRCRDNIMTFCDRHTMTPRLNDACCGGCTPVPSTPKTSDISVTASSVAVRCTQDGYYIPPGYSPRQCAPAPILKKSDASLCRDYRREPLCIRHEAVRDTDEADREPIKSRSIRSFICPRKKSSGGEVHVCNHRERSRKVLYNEGISDHIAEQYTPPPVRPPSPKNLKCDRSKVSVRSRCFIADKNKCIVETDNVVPYAHRGGSKYHHNCKKSGSKQMTSDSDSEEVRHVCTVASPKIARKCYHNRSNKRYRTPSIRFPRKVLTSERDIEAFIERSQVVLTPDDRRCSQS